MRNNICLECTLEDFVDNFEGAGTVTVNKKKLQGFEYRFVAPQQAKHKAIFRLTKGIEWHIFTVKKVTRMLPA